ncbi:hypothetical protein BTVI_81557 [Pitangus sulphuratus]|nr:hypothetical protein BTVI_81557 [Pitangus sulphuratus]
MSGNCMESPGAGFVIENFGRTIMAHLVEALGITLPSAFASAFREKLKSDVSVSTLRWISYIMTESRSAGVYYTCVMEVLPPTPDVPLLHALVLMGDFNLWDVCWKLDTVESRKSRRFLECVEDNFLLQLAVKEHACYQIPALFIMFQCFRNAQLYKRVINKLM